MNASFEVALPPHVGHATRHPSPARVPHGLSGGTQQRVPSARALSPAPTLIGADEPTGALDRTTAGEILGLLERLNDELGKTIIMVTHDPKAADKAHRLVHLEKGILVD